MNIGELLKNMLSPLAQTNAAGSLFNKITGAGLTGAEQEANQFSSSEAEIARQWQEDMYNKYQSPSAMIDQYKDAGLNPALMYGGASGSSANFSSSSPSSVSPSSGSGLSDIIATVTSMAKLKAEIDNVNADTHLKEEAAGEHGARARSISELTPVQKRQIEQDIKSSQQGITESEARCRSLAAQAALYEAEKQGIDIQNKFIEPLKELEIKQRELDVAKTEDERAVLKQQILNMKQEVAESYKRCVVLAAEAKQLDAETENYLIQKGILEKESEKVGAEAEIIKYRASKKEVDRTLEIVHNVVGDVKSVITAGASVYGAYGIGKAGKVAGSSFETAKKSLKSRGVYMYDGQGNIIP